MMTVSHAIYVIAIVGLLVWLFFWWRSIDRDTLPKTMWSCIRREGGGAVFTPYPMTEDSAIEFVSKNLGSVMYVDRTHHFIFYRPRTGI